MCPPSLYFSYIGFITINNFLILYTEKRGIEGGSLFFTVYAAALLFTRPVVGKLTDRFGFVKIGIPAMLLTAVSLHLIGSAENTVALLTAAALNAFGYGAIQPALQSLCMKAVPPERRGSASGTNYLAQDAATLIGPVIAGQVAGSAGYTPGMWDVMTVPVLLGLAVTLVTAGKIGKIEKSFADLPPQK